MIPLSPDLLVAVWLVVAAGSGAALFYISRPRR
jgi:hypothetical protein